MTRWDETDHSHHAIVVGSGIAGSLVARALAERHMSVLVVDSAPPGERPESARMGALYVKPGVDYTPETRFAHRAFMSASEYYTALQNAFPHLPFWRRTGTLQLAWNERESQRQEKLLARNDYTRDFLQPVTPNQASQLAGISLSNSGLWFEQGGAVVQSALRTAAMTHPRIRVISEALVQIQTSKAGRWQLSTGRGTRLQAQSVILATGAATRHWFPELPVSPIRGQITCFRSSGQSPACAISGGGYALPPINGLQAVGATFDRNDPDPTVRDDSHSENLHNLRQWLPELGNRYDFRDIEMGWTGFRGATPDHMPITGTLEGIHLIAGLGGKGLAYAPLLAQCLADSITGNMPALDAGLLRRVAPQRFL